MASEVIELRALEKKNNFLALSYYAGRAEVMIDPDYVPSYSDILFAEVSDSFCFGTMNILDSSPTRFERQVHKMPLFMNRSSGKRTRILVALT